MKKRTTVAVGIAAAAGIGLVAAIGGVAGAAGGDDNDVPITGDALEKASAAALDHLGEGTVTDTEEGDEESYYEVEVTLDDGREVDVQLDRDFNVVGDEVEGPNDNDD
ncbi:MAG: hypothetical protein OEV40_03715 [Acidimicrobiia bacterium]|nr:hypothetical protein [Acidimicrobiia bacterium]